RPQLPVAQRQPLDSARDHPPADCSHRRTSPSDPPCCCPERRRPDPSPAATSHPSSASAADREAHRDTPEPPALPRQRPARSPPLRTCSGPPSDYRSPPSPRSQDYLPVRIQQSSRPASCANTCASPDRSSAPFLSFPPSYIHSAPPPSLYLQRRSPASSCASSPSSTPRSRDAPHPAEDQAAHSPDEMPPA